MWSGQKENHHYHLCRWDLLARPKHCGGWGLINLTTFNTTLLENTLWRVLTVDNIWQRILWDKYLGGSSVVDWLRKSNHQQLKSSSIWSGLTKSIPVLLHWLPVEGRTGNSILIGVDKIVGLEECSILSEPLRLQLSLNHILVLAQARETMGVSPFPDRWRTSFSLGLSVSSLHNGTVSPML
jgi:hypothetical protein